MFFMIAALDEAQASPSMVSGFINAITGPTLNIFLTSVCVVSCLIGSVIADQSSDHLDMAKRLLAQGQYSDALPHLHAAIDGDPNNYLTYFRRATVFLALSRPKPALEDLNKAIELKDEFVSALNQRGYLYVKLGRLDEAHIDFEAILRSDPNNEEAITMYQKIERLKDHYMNVQDLMDDHRNDEALRHFEPLIEMIPWNVDLLKMRAKAFEKIGEIRRAISDYRTMAKLTVDATIFLTISKLSYSAGDINESLNYVRECLKLDPDNQACMKHYKPTKKLNNHINLMVESSQEKNHDTCHTQGKNALKILGDDLPRVSYSIKSVMCRCLSKSGDIIDGLEVCTDAINSAHPEGGIEGLGIDQSELLCDRADLLVDKGDYDEALKSYQESQKIKQSKRAREGIEKTKKVQKQRKKRDYYKILDVSRGAGESEISRAYRKLAAKWHPDRHQDPEDKKVAQAKFMDIADAKAVLTDKEKRQLYDRGEDPLDPESKSQRPPHGFYGDPFGQFGSGGGPFTFKFQFG